VESLLILNGIHTVTSVKRNGREYLVANATLIVPGVLPGSNGPLYYPEDEVKRDVSQWNDVPITVGHPVRNGFHVSGRDPDIDVIGRLHRSTYDGRLRAEAWFDVEATNQVEPRIIDYLRNKKPFGLSTGLFTTNQPAPAGANHNGRSYVATARNYKADHLAVLLDSPGACTIKDGCGFLVNQLLPTLNTPVDPVPLESVTLNEGIHVEVSGGPGFIAELAGLVEVLNKAHPSGMLDMTPDKACKIMKDGMVNGHKLTKRQMGMFGAMCGTKPTTNTDQSPVPSVTGDTMIPLTAEQRAAMVNQLVTNCGCNVVPDDAPWKGRTQTELEKLTDNDLRAMDFARRQIAANAGMTSFVDGYGNQHTYDRTTNTWKTTPKIPTPTQPVAVPTNNTQTQPAPAQTPAPTGTLSPDQWLQQMPEALRPVWNSAVQVHQNEKNQVIGQLVANMAAGEQRDKAVQFLTAKPIEELQMMLSLMPTATGNPNQPTTVLNPFTAPTNNFFGAAGTYPTPVINEAPLEDAKWDFAPQKK